MPAQPRDAEQHDSGLACLVLLARFHGLPADPAQLQHRFGRSGRHFERGDIVRAARHLGLKAHPVSVAIEAVEPEALPCIVELAAGEFAIVAKVEDGSALIHLPGEGVPETIAVENLAARLRGEVLLFTRRAGARGGAARFGIGWFVPSIVKYRRVLAEVVVASFFIQLLALATPLIFQVVIDKVLVHRGLTTLDVLAIGLVAVALFEVLLGGLRTYLFSHTTNRIDVTLGARLYRHVLALPLAYFEARRVGDTVARVRELETVRGFLTSSALTLLIDLVFTVVFFAVMYHYSPVLTWIVLGSVPLYVILSVVVTPLLRARLNEKFDRGADNQAFLVESVTQLETLKSMAIEPQMQQRWEEQLAGYVRAAFKATQLGNISTQTASLIQKITLVALLWLGARLVIEGELSVGQLIAFNMLSARVVSPILRLVQLWQDFQQAGISIERLGDILNAPVEPARDRVSAIPAALEGHVRFEQVSFRYRPDARLALEAIEFEVQPGEVIGLVGRSGCGKSTLAKLLQRMYVPERGRVLLDGVDLAVVDPTWVRRQVAVVMQESNLFNRSIRDNIALGDPGMTMDRVVAAAKLAGAHEFIGELGEGYDTLVGERGATLSGGQRQRIAIARALAVEPRILVLDEATSALDYESERAIQDNLDAIANGRTVFVIAHRLSTVRRADRIIVLDSARIVESGSHQMLLEKGGTYAKLHAYQDGESNLASEP